MKSLLKCEGSLIVVGIGSRAFLVGDDNTKELKENDDNITTSPTDTAKGKNDEQDPKEIQCVAIAVEKASDKKNRIWCAVSRYEKSISIFCDGKFHSKRMTVKRIGSLLFTWEPVGMVVAGDMVGDATAFPLDNTQHKGRLLLGHTASMLTDMKLHGSNILLTADRDEKVRVSSFPQTCIVKGYLLGHTAFTTSIDTVIINSDNDNRSNLCVSCGGDKTLRLWNIDTCSLVTTTATDDLIPTQVAICGDTVAVIFDQSSTIKLYSISNLEYQQSLESATQPLGLQWFGDSKLLVLAKEPCLLQMYEEKSDEKYHSAEDDRISGLVELTKDVELPSTILETDNNGHLKLEKLKEGRLHDEWNRVDRVEKVKANRTKASRKRRSRKRQRAS